MTNIVIDVFEPFTAEFFEKYFLKLLNVNKIV